jgi:hypothetical protein
MFLPRLFEIWTTVRVVFAQFHPLPGQFGPA